MCPRCLCKINENIRSYTDLHADVLCSAVHITKYWKPCKCVSTDEQIVVNPHCGILLSKKREFYIKVNEFQNNFVKWKELAVTGYIEHESISTEL